HQDVVQKVVAPPPTKVGQAPQASTTVKRWVTAPGPVRFRVNTASTPSINGGFSTTEFGGVGHSWMLRMALGLPFTWTFICNRPPPSGVPFTCTGDLDAVGHGCS